MLVLSRKSSEKITIGENITIEVRRIAGNRVTLAIDAPRDIRILRGELEAAVKEFEVSADEAVEELAPAAATYAVSHHRAPLAEVMPSGTFTTSAVG